MRRYLLVALLIVFMAIAGVAFVTWFETHGVHVTVINSGPEPLTEVVVHVTGNEHQIGKLSVGEARTVRVRPTGESHVEISFVDSRQQMHRVNAGGYFEAEDYHGTIEVELEACEIKRNDHKVESLPF